MSLERVVAAPFQQSGGGSLSEQEFVVALSLHRDWFSPAQAKRVVELAVTEGLLERADGVLTPSFDPSTVRVPTGFAPDDDVLTRRSAFESILDRLVAEGAEKRAAVGEINRLQQELEVTIGAAAAIHAAREGIDVREAAGQAARELRAGGD